MYIPCRTFLPPRQTLSGTLRHPQVLCIITQHLWVTTYFKVSIPDNLMDFPEARFSVLELHTCLTTIKDLAQVQVLQIAEALLKQSDVLTGPALEDLPYIAPTARFLDQVAEHFSIIYEPGQVTAGMLCFVSPILSLFQPTGLTQHRHHVSCHAAPWQDCPLCCAALGLQAKSIMGLICSRCRWYKFPCRARSRR